VGCNDVSIFKFGGEFAKRSNSKFEMRDKFAVELRKPDEFSNVADSLRLWTMFKKLMLQHSGPITIQADISTNKFKALGEDVTFPQTQ
jgi:hypothetical protein